MTFPGAPGVQQAPIPPETQANLVRLAQLARKRRIDLRPDQIDQIEDAANDLPCPHCGGFHTRPCPRIRRLAWHPNGTMAEVEFFPDADIDWSEVVFPDDNYWETKARETVLPPGHNTSVAITDDPPPRG